MAKELKPFDKILVRNSNKGYWIPAFYGFKSKDMKHHLTSAGWQDECIPYEGNEEYLGTNKDYVCPEIVESEDEQHRKWMLEYLYDGLRKSDEQFKDQFKCAIAWFEKQDKQNPNKNIVEIWKDMRLEVYQQASGNRHEPNYSDDTTKMFSLNDIDEIFEKVSNSVVEQKPVEWSEEDETNIGRAIDIIKDAKEGLTSYKTDDGIYECEQAIKVLDKLLKNGYSVLWNKADYTNIEKLIKILPQCIFRHPSILERDECRDLIDWLKSLRPKSTWKPTKKQIIAIRWVLNNVPYNKYKEEISGLLDQIKDL